MITVKKSKNRLLSLALALTLVLGTFGFSTMVGAADNVTYIDEDFAAFTTGDNGVTSSRGVLVDVGNVDKALKMSPDGSNAVSATATLSSAVETGYVVASCLVYEPNVAGAMNFQLNSSGTSRMFRIDTGRKSSTSTTDKKATLYVYENSAWNTSKYVYSDEGILRTNKWTQYAAIIDMSGDNAYAYVYLDGQLITENGVAASTKRVSSFSVTAAKAVANLCYVDDMYLAPFTTMEAAQEAVRAKAILAGGKTGQYTASQLTAYKAAADTALKANDTASIKALSDAMIPDATHVLFEQLFDDQAIGSVPSSTNPSYARTTNTLVSQEGNDVFATITRVDSTDGRFVTNTINSATAPWNRSFDKLALEFKIRWNEDITAKKEIFALVDTNQDSSLYRLIVETTDGSAGKIRLEGNWIISAIEKGKWYNIKIVYDHNTKKCMAYVDGEYITEIDAKETSAIYTNGYIGLNKLDFRNINSSISLDNIRLIAATKAPATSFIQKSLFTDENGDAVEKITANGKLTKTYITRNATNATKLYTALYENGTISDVVISDISTAPESVMTAVDVDMNLPADVTNCEIKQFILTSNIVPTAINTTKKSTSSDAKLHILGDSNAWGDALGNEAAIDTNVVTASNLRDCYETAWNSLKPQLNSGDYLIITSGYNDIVTASNSGYNTFLNVNNNYRAYLKLLIENAQERGVTPILVTPINFRDEGTWGNANSIISAVAAMKAVGREMKVDVIDLNTALESVIAGGASGLYTDNTTLSADGAQKCAELIKTAIKNLNNSLSTSFN